MLRFAGALLGVAMMSGLELVKLWLLVRPVKRVKDARRRKRRLRELGIEEGKEVLRGKLTYSGIAVMAVSWVLERFGVPVAAGEIEAIVTAGAAVVGTAIAIYGRYRATKETK